MRRLLPAAFGAMLLMLSVHIPANASVKWVCSVPGEEEDVVFVTAADAALHGIMTANGKAGQVFHDQFGEVCRVVPPS
jgi:hypothetical protein